MSQHTKYQNKAPLNPNKPYQLRHLSRLIIGGLLASQISIATAITPMDTGGEHGNKEVDTSAPIAALQTLDSLKTDTKVELNLPKIVHFKTKNGVPVAFVRTTELPMVDIGLRFNAGSARDGSIRQDGFGIANMTATMLGQGTTTMDENQFAIAVEQLGIQLSSAAAKDMFTIALRSLSDDGHLQPALSLTKDMLSNPSFDPAILERNKAQLMLALQQKLQNPSGVANDAFIKALYDDHPYAHPTSGTQESVPTISRDDLIKFKNNFLVARNASLAITGNLTEEQAKQIANDLTAVLPTGQAAAKLPTPQKLEQTKRIDIPFDSTQTTVLIGQIGNARSTDKDTIQQQTNFSIANDVMAGGDFNARLMKEVRKKRGYTYGISGSMHPMQVNGPYVIGFSTRNDKVEDAINATFDTINDTLENGITESEFNLTKDNMTNSYPMSFSSNASINGMLGMLNFYQLPDSYLTDYLQRLEKTDTNSANQALQQTLTPDKFLIVTVGQAGDAQSSSSEQSKQ